MFRKLLTLVKLLHFFIINRKHLVASEVDLLATTGDVTLSWTSPIYPKLYSNDSSQNPLGRPITENEDALIGALLTLGAAIGPWPFGLLAEKFGRRTALLAIAIPHTISYITMALSRNVYLYYLGRILGGLGMGGGYTVLPIYIAEITKTSNRGAMSQTLNIFWAIGSFLPYAMGPFISILYFNLALSCIPIGFFLLFFFIGPETPYYLVKVNKMKRAKESLMFLRSADEKEVQKELENIQTYLNKEEKGNLLDLFTKRQLCKPFVVCIVLIVFQELSGYCAITFYLQPIFNSAGTKIPSDISALIVGTAMLGSSFFAPLLIEKAGRKKLIVYSCLGMFLSLSLLGAFFYILESTDLPTDSIFLLPIFSLVSYIFFFNLGIGSVPWTLCSELFPSNFKQFASSSVGTVCWLTTFLVTKFFNDMTNELGIAGTFWFFAGSCFLATIFSLLWVPETKGKSFDEIQNMLRGIESKINVYDLQDT